MDSVTKKNSGDTMKSTISYPGKTNKQEHSMKNDTTSVTLYDLMAEDFSVWVKQNPKFGFDLHIEGDDPNEAIEISGVHSDAMQSFSDFCRRFIYFYDKINSDVEAA